MWFDYMLWMSRSYNIIQCLTEWLVWFDETEGKRGLTLGVMLHSIQRLLHFVAHSMCLTCFRYY